MDTQVHIPPSPDRDRIDVRGDRAECGSGSGPWSETAVPIECDQCAAEDDVRQRVHERERSVEPVVGIALRVPVPVEVIPVLGIFPQTFAELIGELLGGALQGFVARTIPGDANGIAKMDGESSWMYAIDEAWQQGRTG